MRALFLSVSLQAQRSAVSSVLEINTRTTNQNAPKQREIVSEIQSLDVPSVSRGSLESCRAESCRAGLPLADIDGRHRGPCAARSKAKSPTSAGVTVPRATRLGIGSSFGVVSKVFCVF